MNDKELQDVLDRLERENGDADLPEETRRSKDFRAYQTLFKALEEEPDEPGLPGDFAERVADRAMPAPAKEPLWSRIPWLEGIALPVAAIVAFIITLVIFPAVGAATLDAFRLVVDPFAEAWTAYRLDVVGMSGAILLLVALIDRMLARTYFHRGRARAGF